MNLSIHIELVKKMVNKILAIGNYEVDEECLLLATYFHGFIYKDEEKIRQWMLEQKYEETTISKTLQIAWESQRSEVPETIPLCEEMNAYTNRFFADLVEGIQD